MQSCSKEVPEVQRKEGSKVELVSKVSKKMPMKNRVQDIPWEDYKRDFGIKTLEVCMSCR